MDDVLDALAGQHAELDALLPDPADDAGWRRPSPCEGWDVADVLLHLTQTDELALASLEGRWGERVGAFGAEGGTTVDDAADALVAANRGQPASVIGDAWRTTAAALRDAFATADLHARVPWVTGHLSARTLATTRLAECWIHAGDVAIALGRPQPATDRERHIARLAWRTLPYAFQRAGTQLAGPVAFHLTGPNGEAWTFDPDPAEGPAATTITGDGHELCLVAGRRVEPAQTSLTGDGPDADAVLALVRTYA